MHNLLYRFTRHAFVRKLIGGTILLLGFPTLCMEPFHQQSFNKIEIENLRIPSLQILAMKKVTPQLHADLIDLIDNNKDITTTTSPILKYAQRQTVPVFAQALSREINRNLLLHEAVQKNRHIQTLDFLLQPGVYIDAKDKDGATPLMLANLIGYYEVAQSLLQSGADVHAKIKKAHDIFTPLICATVNGHYEIVQLLLQFGVDVDDVDTEDNNGNTALICATSQGHHEITKLLLQSGADVHAKNNNGNTPLMLAAKNGHHEIARLLLQFGADIHARDKKGNTSLIHATGNNHYLTIQLLLESAAYVHAKNNAGNTALTFATKNHMHETIQLLQEYGATVDTENNNANISLRSDLIYNTHIETPQIEAPQKHCIVS